MEINHLPFRPTVEGVDLLENVFIQTLRARNGKYILKKLYQRKRKKENNSSPPSSRR